MKAVVCTAYGPAEVLKLQEIEKPSPKADEILIKIECANVNSSDIELRSGDWNWLFWLPARIMYGMFKPRRLIPGYEFAGTVADVGSKVDKFKLGDSVFGAATWRGGCSAEYICLQQDAAIAIKPDSMPMEEAAAFCDSGNTARYFLTKSGIQAGQSVLIYGASGSVGTMAIQIAKYYGAIVTGVCSGANRSMVLSLGADDVIDYTKESLVDYANQYDIVFDTLGKLDLTLALVLLQQQGVFATTRIKPSFRWRTRRENKQHGTNKKIVGGITTAKGEGLQFLIDLYGQGKLKSVIDRCYPFAQLANAHRYVETGRKKGNVVLKVME